MPLLNGFGSIGPALTRFFTGTNNIDTFFGTNANDRFYGLGGDDQFYSSWGSDYYSGGTGTDTVSYVSSPSAVNVDLGTGRGAGGHAAGDSYTNIENIVGSSHADTIIGNAANNQLSGRAGNDTIFGGGGNDTIFGGSGNDTLDGGIGNDTIYAGWGNDDISGGLGNDTLYGDGGNDTFRDGRGSDVYYGGSGVDTIDYSASNSGANVYLHHGYGGDQGDHTDTYHSIEDVVGSRYQDRLFGDSGNNRLWGGEGNDVLGGHAGIDLLDGGGGNDWLTGGKDIDVFSFDHSHNGAGEQDTVTDFVPFVDKLDLERTEIDSWIDLNNSADGDYWEQVGKNVVIHTSNNDTVTLLNVQISDMSPLDLFFS